MLGALIAVVVLALFAVWLLVNPNDYKPQIAAAVHRSTGRELVLEGKIALSVFPRIALELGLRIPGEPRGLSRAALRLRSRTPRSGSGSCRSSRRRLEIGQVELDGLDLKLLKNAAGKANWEGFGRSEGAAPPPAAESPERRPGSPKSAGFKITNARVSYEDVVLENLALETGSLGATVARRR